MNRRQKKKRFKRRFGFNPPRSISIKAATYIMERRKNIITAFEKIKKAILNLWEAVKKPALELATALKEAATAFISNKEPYKYIRGNTQHDKQGIQRRDKEGTDATNVKGVHKRV